MNADRRPIKMVGSRHESFIAGTNRHTARLCYKLGAMRDGTRHALDCRMFYDTGSYDRASKSAFKR